MTELELEEEARDELALLLPWEDTVKSWQSAA